MAEFYPTYDQKAVAKRLYVQYLEAQTDQLFSKWIEVTYPEDRTTLATSEPFEGRKRTDLQQTDRRY